ncbi:Hypothetical protein PBC10988_14910 [Planctomycetales bacterium 10988]|nr:Hypothetical protein PBC10988_14910 [Planctomycetales bacterium 10988]
MKFKQTQRPRNYFSRKEQWRLLLLVMTLGLILILAEQAANPDSWNWLWGVASQENQEPESVDNRLRPEPEPEDEGLIAVELAMVGQEDEPQDPRYFPGIQPEDLKSIRDRTPHRSASWEAYVQMLGILQEHPDQDFRDWLQQRDLNYPITFSQLYDQPESYRGQLVKVKGSLRRAFKIPAPENEFGIEEYYQLWITPDPNNVIVVYALSIPQEIPLNNDQEEIVNQDEAVELVGFFFKLWAHPAAQGISITPMVLAKTMTWEPKPEAAPEESEPPSLGTMIGIICAVLSGSLIIAALAFMQGNWRSKTVRRQREAIVPEDAIDSLANVEPEPDVEEQLRRLSEQAALAESEEETL